MIKLSKVFKMFRSSRQRRVDYHEYIRSPRWRRKANYAKDLAGQRCRVCNEHSSDVILDAHHRTYERLGHERIDDITVLCRDCHGLYEKSKRMRKASKSTKVE